MSRSAYSLYRLRRCDCIYGPTGPPMSGPSSCSRPHWSSVRYMTSVAPSTRRFWSVSSMRRIKLPPAWRAIRYVYRAVRRFPTCMYPVGEGANRVRTFPFGILSSISSYHAASFIGTPGPCRAASEPASFPSVRPSEQASCPDHLIVFYTGKVVKYRAQW